MTATKENKISERLQEIEGIAADAISLFSEPESKIELNLENKTAKEIKEIADSLLWENKKNAKEFNKELQYFRGVDPKNYQIEFMQRIMKNAKESAIELNKLQQKIEEYSNLENDLAKKFFEKKKKEVHETLDETERLRKKYQGFGALLYSRRIKDTEKKLDELMKLDLARFKKNKLEQEDDAINLDDEIEDKVSYVSDRFDYKIAKERIFADVCERILEEHKDLIEEFDRNVYEKAELKADVLESLADEYIEKHCMKEITEATDCLLERANGKYAEEHILRSKQQAIELIKDSYTGHKLRNWQEILQQIESTIGAVVEEKRQPRVYDSKNAFEKIAWHIQEVLNIPEREKLLKSLKETGEALLKTYPKDDKWLVQHDFNEILDDNKNHVKINPYNIDIQKWLLFRQNKKIKEIFDEQSLEDFNNLLKEKIWKDLLTIQPRIRESAELGQKAAGFPEQKYIPYLVLNFWREDKFSRYHPNIYEEQELEDRPGIKAICELEDLRAFEKIPGLVNLINTVKQNPKGFLDEREKIEENLAEMCKHYLENGTQQEKYFVIGVTSRLVFMQDKERGPSQAKQDLIDKLVNALELNEHEKEQFNNKQDLFLEKTWSLQSYNASDNKLRENPLPHISKNIKALQKYVDDATELLEKAQNKELLEKEAEDIQEKVFEKYYDVQRLGKFAIHYLENLDSEKVQQYFNDCEWGEIFKQKWKNTKEKIFDHNNKESPEKEYFVNALDKLDEFIKETSKVFENSEVKEILKEEYKRQVEKAVRYDALDDLDCLENYLNAINDPKAAKQFKELDEYRKEHLYMVAKKAHKTEKQIAVPLVRKIIEKEKSPHKINLLEKGLDLLEGRSREQLKGQFITLFANQPGAAYEAFCKLAMVKPIIDDQFDEDLKQIFEVAEKEYEVGSKAKKAIQEKGLEGDMEIKSYCQLMEYQGKKVKEKKILDLVKIKEQISRYKKELDEKPDNEIARKQLEERVEKTSAVLQNEKTNAVMHATNAVCVRAMEKIVGYKPELKELNDQLIHAVLLYNDIIRNKDLMQEILKDVLEGKPNKIYEREENQNALERFKEKGINMGAWLKGVEIEYMPQENKDLVAVKEAKYKEYKEEAMRLYEKIGQKVKEEEILEKYKEIREEKEIDEELLRDLKTQVNAIKRLEQDIYKSNLQKVRVYTEQDPLNALKMGSYFNDSCLAVGKGNSWSAVSNVADINKQIIYAEMDGEIIARKLAALTSDGKIVQYRTYNNRHDLNVDPCFNSYFKKLSEATGAELANQGIVEKLVAKEWYDDGIRDLQKNKIER